MNLQEAVKTLYEGKPKTDMELVVEAKDEIAIALSKEVTLKDLFSIMREYGFKGDIRKFTRILQQLGLREIRVGHRKPVVNKPRSVETPANPATAHTPAAEEPASSPNYRIDSNGTKIWGGKKNNNPASAPAKKPVEDDKAKGIYKPGGTTQEDLEKIFGKAAFF